MIWRTSQRCPFDSSRLKTIEGVQSSRLGTTERLYYWNGTNIFGTIEQHAAKTGSVLCIAPHLMWDAADSGGWPGVPALQFFPFVFAAIVVVWVIGLSIFCKIRKEHSRDSIDFPQSVFAVIQTVAYTSSPSAWTFLKHERGNSSSGWPMSG